MRRRKLDFEPISTDDYLAELKDLKADRKALHDRYRQSRAYELSEALTKIENALRGLYGRLFDCARMMSVHQIALTTEQQIEAERITRDRFNQCAERAGWGVRLEPCGGPIEGGIKIVETRPGGYAEAKTLAEQRRGEWFAGVFEFLWMTGESERVHPQMFAAQVARHWDERLRKCAAGKDFADLNYSRDRAIELEENQRKEWARDVKRRAKNLDRHLTTHRIDALVPPNWPTNDGVTPISKPQVARNEIVVDPKTKKRTALFPRPSLIQSMIYQWRGFWNPHPYPERKGDTDDDGSKRTHDRNRED